MKDENIVTIVAGIALSIIVIVGIFLGIRWLNSVSSVVNVVHPNPGIECIVATTTDGTGIDCNWRKK